MKKALIAILAAAPLLAHGFNIFGTVDLWRFTLQAKTKGVCARDVTYDWAGMKVLSFFGTSPELVCQPWGSTATIQIPLTDAPLIVRWSDTRGERHIESLPIKQLIGRRTLYGGGLILRFDDTDLEVFLVEPDKSKPKSALIWPKKSEVKIFPSQ